MLEFVELKVLLHAKEVKMYFIYMALDFARTPNTKNYGPDFARTKIHGKDQEKNFSSFFGVWQITKVHLSLATVWVHFIELLN